MSEYPIRLFDLAGDAGNLLKKRGETIAVAESPSGGLVSASLLSMSGASWHYKLPRFTSKRTSLIGKANLAPRFFGLELRFSLETGPLHSMPGSHDGSTRISSKYS